MHSSGSITSMFGPSRKQSTGHTSTQSVYLHLMQVSVTTWVIGSRPRSARKGLSHYTDRNLSRRPHGATEWALARAGRPRLSAWHRRSCIFRRSPGEVMNDWSAEVAWAFGAVLARRAVRVSGGGPGDDQTRRAE